MKIDLSDEEWVDRALDYLSSFKEEMTSDKKHYTEVLIKEVKRLRVKVDYLNEIIDSERKKVYDIAQKLLEVIE